MADVLIQQASKEQLAECDRLADQPAAAGKHLRRGLQKR